MQAVRRGGPVGVDVVLRREPDLVEVEADADDLGMGWAATISTNSTARAGPSSRLMAGIRLLSSPRSALMSAMPPSTPASIVGYSTPISKCDSGLKNSST